MKERCRGRANPARPGPLAMTEGTFQFYIYQNQVLVAMAAECTAREAAALRRRSLAQQVATALRAGSTQATHHDNYELWGILAALLRMVDQRHRQRLRTTPERSSCRVPRESRPSSSESGWWERSMPANRCARKPNGKSGEIHAKEQNKNSEHYW